MGLFSYFNKKSNGVETNEAPNARATLPIPEDLFIEKENTNDGKQMQNNNASLNDNGISLLFGFLERNHEAQGYDDALINPDATHLKENIDALKNELSRIIRRVKTFYEDFIMEINFHIESRTRSGMVDTVDELNMKKEIARNHLQKVKEIEQEALNNHGDSQGILMSYTKGFRNGLAAITHHSIINKKF